MKKLLNIRKSPVLNSKWGTARIKEGYYKIASYKEGNYGKMLHDLIYEATNGKLPDGWYVTHKDGDNLNNCIQNLKKDINWKDFFPLKRL